MSTFFVRTISIALEEGVEEGRATKKKKNRDLYSPRLYCQNLHFKLGNGGLLKKNKDL